MEVTCDLVRGPVYLTGEEVECVVTFANNSQETECLAWGSAQLHCFCTVNENKVFGVKNKVRKISTNTQGGKTSFQPTEGENGLAVLSTKTKILFCSEQFDPGEKKEFILREKIPASAPPSYRGHAVKYSYKLVIGSQRFGQDAVLHRIPLRIMSVDTQCHIEEEERLGPSNPFLEEISTKEAPLDILMQSIQDVTSRRSPSNYVIANSRGKVCKFCIYKKNYKLGEDIIGSFDFSFGDVQCLQYSVTLQLIENIEKEYRTNTDEVSKIVNHTKYHEVCVGYSQSHLVLPVPLQLSPSFSTTVLNVQYQLHFEFVTSVERIEEQDIPEDGGGSEWQGPCKVDIETMVWDLPLKLYPTFPSHTVPHSNLPSYHRNKL